jgi:hypothetical protein
VFKKIKKQIIAHRFAEEILYEYVLDEIEEEGIVSRGLWAKAIAISEGDDNKANSLYMQYRVQSIRDYVETLNYMKEEITKTHLRRLLKNKNCQLAQNDEEMIQKCRKRLISKGYKLDGEKYNWVIEDPIGEFFEIKSIEQLESYTINKMTDLPNKPRFNEAENKECVNCLHYKLIDARKPPWCSFLGINVQSTETCLNYKPNSL